MAIYDNKAEINRPCGFWVQSSILWGYLTVYCADFDAVSCNVNGLLSPIKCMLKVDSLGYRSIYKSIDILTYNHHR